MNHEAPGMERRLLLAMALTAVILGGWPILATRLGWMVPETPKYEQVVKNVDKPQSSGIESDIGTSIPHTPISQTVFRSIETTSTHMDVAEETGSLVGVTIKPHGYRADLTELELLTAAQGPGLGAVAWTRDPSGSLTAWTGWQPVVDQALPMFKGQPVPGVLAELRYAAEAASNTWTLTLAVTNRGSSPQPVQPRLLSGRVLHDPLEQGRYRLLRASVAGKVRTLPVGRAPSPQHWPGVVDWVTAQTKYYTAIVEPLTKPSALVVTADGAGQPQGWLEWPVATVAPGQTHTWHVRGYAGPLDYRRLDPLKLDRAVSLGAFTVVARLLQTAMNTLAGLLHSQGAAIVALTLFLTLLLWPVTGVSFRAMKKLERLQPELQAVQARHREDPRRMNEEVMKLYKAHQVNPLAGCLPMLVVQTPIFIALYQVLTRSPELRGARFWLIRDLSAPDALLPLPAVIPLLGSAINVLPLAMAGMMVLQQRLSARGRALSAEQQVQQRIFGIMPAMFGLLFYSLPSGLVLYWLLNTAFSVAQQQLILRRMA